MTMTTRTLWLLLIAILGLRLASLGLYPLMDTSEARYAEMARKMLVLGNWVTPLFELDVPFWGKPPLSFWSQALGMKKSAIFLRLIMPQMWRHALPGLGNQWLVLLKDTALVSLISAQLLENTRAFADYGILPELVGRFSRLVPFQPLGEEVLREILDDTLIHKYRAEFEREGVSLDITDAAIGYIIETAHRRETGARALRASLVPYLEEAAFETFGKDADEKSHAKIDFDGSAIQLDLF